MSEHLLPHQRSSCTRRVEDETRREVKEGENQLLLSFCLCCIPVSASRGQGSTCSELGLCVVWSVAPLEPHQPRFLLLEMEPVFKRERKQRCCVSPFPWLHSLLVAMWQYWRCLSGFFQEVGASPCLILQRGAKRVLLVVMRCKSRYPVHPRCPGGG